MGGHPVAPAQDVISGAAEDDQNTGTDILEEVAIFLGADRRPALALREIRDVHDLKDWSYNLKIPNAVERCRTALEDLTRSDYNDWDETAMVVVVVSTMAQKDASGLVRNDCVRALAWFYDWIHPLAEAIPPGAGGGEQGVLEALRAMDSILGKEKPFASAADRMVLVDAIAMLGSHPWSEVVTPDPVLIRNRLAQPRGVSRALAGRIFREGRAADPMIADVLDRALIRVLSQVLSMSLLGALADPADHVRSAAARTIGDRRLAEAVPTMAYALPREKEASVRIAWIAVLGDRSSGNPESTKAAVPALAAVLSDPNGSVRLAAVRELGRLTGENPGAEATDWQRWWREKAPEYEVK